MLRIGLTGGIGSGKSTVAALLSALGATVIDTDAIARALTLPGGPALPAIVNLFGPTLLDAQGALDRGRLRELVFSVPAAKAQLEAILHPMIGAECDRQAAAALAAATPVLVFDVPLLVESRRWRARVERVLVVDATEATQLRRVMARSGWTEAAVRAVIAQQATRVARRAAADAVIFNDALTLAELQTKVYEIFRIWAARAA